MDLTPQDWQQIKDIFNQVIEYPPDEMAAAMDRLCADVPALKPMVQQMVDTHVASQEQTITPQQSAASTLVAQGMLKAGDQFAKYQIIQPIGSGGMGQVYLAQRDDEVVQQVAIKVLNQHSMDAQGLARFDAERRILASLEHPNIARLIDAGTENGQSYYVMEYAEGQPIDQYCRDKQLSLTARLQLFQQICEAVSLAHSNLIVHRDLKPGNILVTEQGEVKLLDFGIAKPLKTLPGTEQVHETIVGTTALTPQYAAPEQINGDPITVSCDVYVLGLLLYRLLTDQHAFKLEGKTWGEIEQVINEQLPTLPSKLLSKVKTSPNWSNKLKGDLDAIVSHALKKEPPERYLSVREMSSDIARYLNNEPLQIKQSQTAYRLKKQLRKHWLPVSALTTIFGVLAISSVLIWQQSQTIAEERDKALNEKQKALTEKQVAEEVTNFLVDTFKSADPTQTLGTEVTAADILEQGVKQLETQDPNPTVKNRLLTALSEVYMNLSAFEEAGSLAEQVSEERLLDRKDQISLLYVKSKVLSEKGQVKQALDLMEAFEFEAAEKNELYFKIMNLKSNLLRGNDQFEAAQQLVKKLRDEAASLFGQDSFIYAVQLRQYAYRTKSFEDRNPTIELYRQAINIFEALDDIPNPLELLETKRLLMIELAGNLQYEESLAINFELEKAYSKVFDQDHVMFARLYNSRGRAYSNSGKPLDSIESYQKSRAIYLKSSGEMSTSVAFTEINMAVVYLYRMPNYQRSKELFETALDKFVENSGKTNNYHYMSLPYALCLIKLKQYDTAKNRIQESLSYYLGREKKSQSNISLAKSLLANVLVHEGDYLAAEELYVQSIDSVMKHYGDTIHRDIIMNDLVIIKNNLGDKFNLDEWLAESNPE